MKHVVHTELTKATICLFLREVLLIILSEPSNRSESQIMINSKIVVVDGPIYPYQK